MRAIVQGIRVNTPNNLCNPKHNEHNYYIYLVFFLSIESIGVFCPLFNIRVQERKIITFGLCR